MMVALSAAASAVNLEWQTVLSKVGNWAEKTVETMDMMMVEKRAALMVMKLVCLLAE